MHKPNRFVLYLLFALELLLASGCMVFFIGVTAGVSVIFHQVLAKEWIKLRFAEPIFTGVEYFLIAVAIFGFAQMCFYSIAMFTLELRMFYSQVKVAVLKAEEALKASSTPSQPSQSTPSQSTPSQSTPSQSTPSQSTPSTVLEKA